MIQISFLTIHPQFVKAYFDFGVMASGSKQNLLKADAIDLRDFAIDKRGSIDAPPYGGGDGMVMRPEPLVAALKSVGGCPKVILPSPGAPQITQSDCKALAESESLVFVCGRFGGVDQRFIDGYVDFQFSVGDFVISGGELPALTLADGICRQIPGVLGNAQSVESDSFGAAFQGCLEHPLYTKPVEFEGQTVPEVLRSGDHKKITEWKMAMSLKKTKDWRQDLLN